jgi:sugar O-acyltransferase (sialic acid O-acetyltransferase NeuD family)
MKPLVVFGNAEMAEVAEYYFRADGGRHVAAFSVDSGYLKEERFLGRPVVAFEELTKVFPPATHELFVAVGYGKLNAVRAGKMEEAGAKGYGLAHYVSSHAFVWQGFEPCPNSFILEDNTLQPFSRVGRGSFLWSGNHIGHHSVIGDNCFITSHVVISGGVTVGERCFIGVNATLRDHINIGPCCIIGAGALILADAPPESVFAAKATERASVPSSRIRNI